RYAKIAPTSSRANVSDSITMNRCPLRFSLLLPQHPGLNDDPHVKFPITGPIWYHSDTGRKCVRCSGLPELYTSPIQTVEHAGHNFSHVRNWSSASRLQTCKGDSCRICSIGQWNTSNRSGLKRSAKT